MSLDKKANYTLNDDQMEFFGECLMKECPTIADAVTATIDSIPSYVSRISKLQSENTKLIEVLKWSRLLMSGVELTEGEGLRVVIAIEACSDIKIP